MKEFFYQINRVLIILFCLFHMAAIALVAMPRGVLRIDAGILRIVQPYVLTFSQWQGWDLFSPNPAVIRVFRIEARAEGYWTTAIALSHANLSWWRSERELKTLTRLTDLGNRASPILSRYIESYCDVLELEPGRYIRLILSQQSQPDRALTETQCPEPGTGPAPVRFLQAR